MTLIISAGSSCFDDGIDHELVRRVAEREVAEVCEHARDVGVRGAELLLERCDATHDALQHVDELALALIARAFMMRLLRLV